jgi:prepilin-type N-terminal cleavage/methylation domain-containing protein
MVVTGKRRWSLSESGFTLIEMLVALTLVAIIAVGLWSVFSVSVRAWSRGTESIDQTQRHRSILDKVRKQIASAYPLNGPTDLPLDLPEDLAVSAQQLSARNLIFTGAETSLSFISLNSLRFQESPGLTIVSYEVALDSQGDYSLVEREARYTGQTFDQEVLENLSEATPVFESLSSCIFEYFDPGNNDNTSQWVSTWSAQDRRQLPAAISITMISRDPKGNLLNRHMVVPVQAQVDNFRVNPVSAFGGRIRAVVR